MAFRTHGDILRTNTYPCNTAIRSGAIVTINSAGNVVEMTNNSTAVLGIAVGYADGTNLTEVAVADHPQQEYIADTDNSSAVAQSAYGQNCSAVAGTVYMTTESGHLVDHASYATTSTLPFRIVKAKDDFDSGTKNGVVVRPNNHVEKSGVTGI